MKWNLFLIYKKAKMQKTWSDLAPLTLYKKYMIRVQKYEKNTEKTENRCKQNRENKGSYVWNSLTYIKRFTYIIIYTNRYIIHMYIYILRS